jgi:membrane-associated protease RseP (regulator of RpoE activity)
MMQSNWMRGLALVVVAGAIVTDGLARAQDAPEKAIGNAKAIDKAKQLLQAAAAQDKAKAAIAIANELVFDVPPSDYWLGVQVAGLPEVAKKQLAIEDGLAVEDVTDGSPAAKAQITKYDILVQAGDLPLKNTRDLVKAVDASQGKELTLMIVRDGKKQAVKVIADRRPQSERAELNVEAVKRKIASQNPEVAAQIKQLEEALAKLKNTVGKEGVGLLFLKPGVVTPRIDLRLPEAKAPGVVVTRGYGEFPKDMTVDIKKQGGEPAKIHVKRGDQEWEVAEDKLSDLPADIQHFVKQMLGKPTANSYTMRLAAPAKVGSVEIAPAPPKPPVAPKAAAAAKAPAEATATQTYEVIRQKTADHVDEKLTALMKHLEGRGGMLEKLDKLDKKVEELRHEVDEVRGKLK